MIEGMNASGDSGIKTVEITQQPFSNHDLTGEI